MAARTFANLKSKAGFLNAYVFLCTDSLITGGREEPALDSIRLLFFFLSTA